MKKKNREAGMISWTVTGCINIALITFFSLLFIAINGMAEKAEDDINDLKTESLMINENLYVKKQKREKLWTKVELIAEESLGMISIRKQ